MAKKEQDTREDDIRDGLKLWEEMKGTNAESKEGKSLKLSTVQEVAPMTIKLGDLFPSLARLSAEGSENTAC